MLTLVKPKRVVIKPLINISLKNTKLGKIPSFSLSAIESCPGKTTWCENKCYADKVERIYKNAEIAYRYNLLQARTNKDFVLLMNTELSKLSKKGIKKFRWHVSGDFFSVKYIYDWINIVKANPEIVFYGYTRTWSISNLLPHLEALRCLPNVILFASTDISTVGSIPSGWKEAWAGDLMPNKPKLLFCLEQAGHVKTCEQCGICFNPASTANIYFETH